MTIICIHFLPSENTAYCRGMHKVEINKVVYILSNDTSAIGHSSTSLQGGSQSPSSKFFIPSHTQKMKKKQKKN